MITIVLLIGNVYVTIVLVIKVVELLLDDQRSPYREWFNSLDALAAAKVTSAIFRMEHGNTSNIKWFRGIGEYRIDWGPGYRIYVGKDADKLIVLLGGGTKKRQQKDIGRAADLWRDYKKRKPHRR